MSEFFRDIILFSKGFDTLLCIVGTIGVICFVIYLYIMGRMGRRNGKRS